MHHRENNRFYPVSPVSELCPTLQTWATCATCATWTTSPLYTQSLVLTHRSRSFSKSFPVVTFQGTSILWRASFSKHHLPRHPRGFHPQHPSVPAMQTSGKGRRRRHDVGRVVQVLLPSAFLSGGRPLQRGIFNG